MRARKKVTGNEATSASATCFVFPYCWAVRTIAATASIPASIGGRTRENMTDSSPSASTPRARMPTAKTQPPSEMMKIAKTIAGIATSTRAPRSEPWRRSGGAAIALSRPEAAAPGRELLQRLRERLAREVRPELVAEDELRVGDLPQEVVRDALLAAGSNQEVG